MRITKAIFGLIIGTALFFIPIGANETSKSNLKPLAKVASLNSLDFEVMKGLSYWYGNVEEYALINSFIEKHGILKNIDELISRERDSLIQMVKNYTLKDKKLKYSKYIKEVYPKFVELNEEIKKKKASLYNYDILERDINSLFLTKDSSYHLNIFQRKTLEKYFSYTCFLQNLIRKYPKDSYYNVTATTILNCSDLLVLIKGLSRDIEMEEERILSLISSESLGYRYLAGRSGDVNLFQINPGMINPLYARLKKSRLDDDNLYKEVFKLDLINMGKFEDDILTDPLKNTFLGMYLIKELKKESKNESHFVLLYHLGSSRFSLLPSDIRSEVLSGKIKSSSDINKNDRKNKGIDYLYHYFRKKEHFLNIKNTFSIYNALWDKLP